MNNKRLDIHIEDFDPLAKLLNRLRFTPLRLGLAIIFANLIVDSGLGLQFNVFFSNTSVPGLLQDVMALSFDFFILPIICGAYLWTSQGGNNLFGDLSVRGIFKSPTATRRTIQYIFSRQQGQYIFTLALFIGCLFAFAQVAAYMHWVPWNTINGYLYLYPPMSFFRFPFWFIAFYAITFGVFNLGLTITLLSDISSQSRGLNIFPLHPDRCGGLGVIGNYATKTGYVIAPIGIYASIGALIEFYNNTFWVAYPVQIFIVAYILLAPVVFIFPMYEIHKAMVRQKEKELLQIARLYNNEVEDAKVKFQASQTVNSNLEYIQKLYEQTLKNYPVWPYNFNNLREFLFASISPLIPIFLSLATDFLLKRLLP